jgi:ABC-type sulfate/molybdate transport systems ATPase subunit
MSMLELSYVVTGPLAGLNVALDPGHHVLLGRISDGTEAFVRLVAGLERPRRGTVRVNGHDPWRSPEARRTVGSLLARESLLSALTVSDVVHKALSLRGDSRPRHLVLDSFKLAAWGPRRVESLDPGERRSVALALALSIPKPAVLALHEPLADLPSLTRSVILERLTLAASEGACVVSVTGSAQDAALLSDDVLLLDRGRIARRPPLPLATHLAPGSAQALIVRTPDPRSLAAGLARTGHVTGLRWDDVQTPGELVVEGPDLSQVSMQVIRLARHAKIPVSGLGTTLPELDIVRAASAGLARAAYERAYRAAQAAAVAAPAGPGAAAGGSG